MYSHRREHSLTRSRFGRVRLFWSPKHRAYNWHLAHLQLDRRQFLDELFESHRRRRRGPQIFTRMQAQWLLLNRQGQSFQNFFVSETNRNKQGRRRVQKQYWAVLLFQLHFVGADSSLRFQSCRTRILAWLPNKEWSQDWRVYLSLHELETDGQIHSLSHIFRNRALILYWQQ